MPLVSSRAGDRATLPTLAPLPPSPILPAARAGRRQLVRPAVKVAAGPSSSLRGGSGGCGRLGLPGGPRRRDDGGGGLCHGFGGAPTRSDDRAAGARSSVAGRGVGVPRGGDAEDAVEAVMADA
jgi:hypothetical protein